MGNAGSTSMHRERHKSSDISTPNSPFRELPLRGEGGSTAQGIAAVSGGQAFTFDKKRDSVLHGGSSQEDDETTSEPYYTKPIGKAANEQQQQQQQQQTAAAAVDPEFSSTEPRKRSSTISEGTTTSSISSTTTQIMPQHKDTSAAAAEANDESQQKTQQQQDEEDLRNPALPTVLRWDGGGQNVMISGTFTKWKPIPMVRSHGNFVTIIDLPEGDHQYKFCVDGEWKHDPKLKSVENDVGEKTNLVSVRQSDFEVFQALAKDSENCVNNADKEYSQDVPQSKPWEKVSGPPILPPHLLQVILNKDTPLSCEPTLLPEPNHVMLNHLYALSIKDGVMVLSATHRYRKKYVTTLLYKPI
ncbi:5'-AMP-activated protein kinase subunit beta-1 [Lucilia sericata]|uniref:5'-AMP-activated protein kinase subunit beta-1 n=1 Tax=Lucilia sericata TaxID=13632 RepID=UPI0018A80D8B|nr:5'-AMP-activated protein kinase subunit beta-1 [Lucilia sericata]